MTTLVEISRQLRDAVDGLRFGPPVTHVYNPLDYARGPHEAYLTRYGTGPKEIVLMGMNPGPWGMAQTGVPFGEVGLVRDWLGIDGTVGRPEPEHPKRPIQGFGCHRSEISGARFWGWIRERFQTPERFFSRFFVANYCPLAFLVDTGRNFTPDKLRAAERAPLVEACDAALMATLEVLQPRMVVGVGAFAEKVARGVQKRLGGPNDPAFHVGRMLHPSPASPKANRGWAPLAEADLQALGIELPTTSQRPGTNPT